VRASQLNIIEGKTAREAIDRISASLNDFEGNWLAAPGSGRLSLYAGLNELIRSNGLRNTSGPSYTTLAPLGTKGQVQPTVSAEQQSNAKWQSIYPGISVSVTVEGPYQSVRHFVRDIEMSRQFLIINAVELEGVTQSGTSTPETSTSNVQQLFVPFFLKHGGFIATRLADDANEVVIRQRRRPSR